MVTDFAGMLLELQAIVIEELGVDAVVIDGGRTFDTEIQLHGAAADDFARGGFDLGFERSIAFVRAKRELEVPAVDSADFDGDGHFARLATGFAKAGHANEQGSSLRKCCGRRGAYLLGGACLSVAAAGGEAGGLEFVAVGGEAGAATGGVAVAGGAAGAAVPAGALFDSGGAAVLPDGSAFFAGNRPDCVSPADDAAVDVAPSTSPRYLAHMRAARQNTIQIDAVMMVMRVNTSPAFAPKALEPPMPPRAPAKPPPRPRWTSTSRIRKIASSDNTMAKMGPITANYLKGRM